MPPYELTPDDVSQIRKLTTFFRDSMKRLAEWGEIVRGLPGRLDLLEAAVRESSTDEANAVRELAAKIKRLEELELLRQTRRGNSARSKKLTGEIKDSHDIEHLQEMLITVTRNLQRAQLAKAKLGGEVDFRLETRIEEFTATIEEIEAQLAALKKHQLKSSNPSGPG